MTGAREAACAVDALRRGWPVTIGGAITVLAIETADTESLRAFDPEAQADILISAGRAATLKLTNQRNAAAPDAPVRVARTRWLGLSEATALADPALDLATPMKGPFEAIAVTSAEASAAALQLARHAGLLPAFFVASGRLPDAIAVTPEAINAYEGAARLRIVSRARLPVEAAEQSEIIAFRTPEAGLEHVALMIGSPNGQPPLVRLHSECLTGDVLGSLKCDCGPQLQAALRLMAEQGWGILLYLRQEGRGIGLINKLRAYSLQDGGLDTVEANERLGFPADLRNYGVGAQILSDLGIHRLRLITNNPRKIAGLGGYGLQVEDRVPLVMDASQHNAAYLQTKQTKLGHLMDASAQAGPAAVLAWTMGSKGRADAEGAGALVAERLQDLRHWAEEQGVVLEREEHARVLALLDQPQLAVLVEGGNAAVLAEGLQRMAAWSATQSVSLLLAPDSQRSAHPSSTLEAQRRPLLELQAARPQLRVDAGTLMRWC